MTKRQSNNKKNQKMNQNLLTAGLLIVILLVGAGFLFISNNQDGSVTADIVGGTISPQQYQSTFVSNNTDHILVDVRTPEEFLSGHIAGAVNIPLQELPQRLSEIPTDKDVVVYCRSGNRSAQASGILASNDYTNIYDLGGVIAWQQAGYILQ